MLLTWTPLKSRYGSAACGCAGCCEGGAYTLTSADGLAFAPLFGKDGALRPAYIGSDTQQTGHWDHVLGKYVVFVRGHQAGPAERTVLRCLTTDLRNWTSETPDARKTRLPDGPGAGCARTGVDRLLHKRRHSVRRRFGRERPLLPDPIPALLRRAS